MKFSTICKVLKKIGSISGTNEKIALIKSIEDDDLKEVYKWLFDNSRISGIAEKRFEKDYGLELAGDWSTCDQKTIQDVFRYLDSHHTGAGKDVIEVKDLMDKICTTDEEKEIFKKIVCKNLPLGVDSKTINKCFPGLIPTFDVCLCDKYYDKPELVDGTREFAVSTKIDGCRCIAIKERGNVRLISRQGKPWVGCKEIEEAIRKLPIDNFVFDGEITIKDFMKYPSKDVYKMTTKIISTKDEEKTGVCLNIFDGLPLNQWNEKRCVQPYNLRHLYLSELSSDNNSDALNFLEDIYVGKDVSKIEELMKGIVREEDWEGLVIKFTDSLYEWKRSKNWLKVKAFEEMDLIVKDVEEGTNSNKGRLGALICEIEHPKLGHIEAKVGPGYSEDERIRLWDMKKELIGRVISVQYFEQTENTTTKIKSLRFPVFLELKEEGQKKITELGYSDSLSRRFATLDDLTVNNILFSNRDVAKEKNLDVFGELKASAASKPMKFNKVEEISAEKFVKDILPTARELAKEIWNLSTTEQIQLLKCLDDCFYQDSMQGDIQLASVYNALNDGSEENEIIEKAKHFLSKINDFLIME